MGELGGHPTLSGAGCCCAAQRHGATGGSREASALPRKHIQTKVWFGCWHVSRFGWVSRAHIYSYMNHGEGIHFLREKRSKMELHDVQNKLGVCVTHEQTTAELFIL